MEYKICKRCIMDTSDPEITFDKNGICKHCYRYDNILESRVFNGNLAKSKLDEMIIKIKKNGGHTVLQGPLYLESWKHQRVKI